MLAFDKVAELKVLFIGDDIVDRYTMVNVVGKSAKDPILSAVRVGSEDYTGGIRAAAAHISELCARVDVWAPNAKVTSEKFVEGAHYRKLFSMHHEPAKDGAPALPNLRDYDCVVVIDFGHGAMTDEMVAYVSKHARFLAVNAQTNAVNYGFNLINRYPRADYVVLDELEARLAAGLRDAPLEDVILALERKRIIVTCGKNGALGFDGAFERQPARTQAVIDTIGAGDAFLAVTAPFASVGASMRDLIALGNAAGAVKVGIVGHRKHVTADRLMEQLGYPYG